MKPMKPMPTLLDEIPALAWEAWATWGTQPISDEGRRRSPGPRMATGASMPDYTLADLDRLVALDPDHAESAMAVLSGWVRALHEHRDEQDAADDWPANTVPAACLWLADRLDWIDLHPLLTEGLHEDLHDLHTSLRVVCKQREPYTPRCRKCAHDVVGIGPDKQRTDDWDAAAYGFCLGCAETYPKGPALQTLGQLQEFTLAEIAERARFNEWTLRDWAKKGLLEPKGRQGNARTFDIGVVMALIEASRKVA